MATFWKGFSIFWIIFLIWYLTGGPQRVSTNGVTPATTFDSNGVGNIATSSNSFQPQINSDKSFSGKLKTNTINVTN